LEIPIGTNFGDIVNGNYRSVDLQSSFYWKIGFQKRQKRETQEQQKKSEKHKMLPNQKSFIFPHDTRHPRVASLAAAKFRERHNSQTHLPHQPRNENRHLWLFEKRGPLTSLHPQK
jgi:hypothetical protein